MTDINPWEQLVHRVDIWPKGVVVERLPDGTFVGHNPSTYVVVPLNEYQIGNLVGLLSRSGQHDNGDWFHEFAYILAEAMEELGLEAINNNFGDRITLASLKDGTWRKPQ